MCAAQRSIWYLGTGECPAGYPQQMRQSPAAAAMKGDGAAAATGVQEGAAGGVCMCK